MALTQAQKDIISEVSQNPDKVLSDFKKFPSILNGFKNEFFQDGTSLLDKVLYQYFLTENQIFFDLYCFIVDNSLISPFDYKGHKLSAIGNMYNLNKSGLNNNFNQLFFDVINYKKFSNLEHNFYLIEKHIVNLYESNNLDQFNILLEKYKNDFKSFHSFKPLMKKVIENNDINTFTSLLNIDKIKNNLAMFDFSDNIDKNFKNILYFCIENNSLKILKEILNEKNLYENKEISYYNGQKNRIPILNALEHHLSSDILFSILNNLDNNLLENFNYLKNGERISLYLMNNYDYSLIEPFLIKSLKSSSSSYEIANIWKSILQSNISYENKYDLLHNYLDKNISEKYSFTSLFNSFISDVQKNKISQTIFDKIIDEFSTRDLISNDNIFNNQYFTNIDYFHLINKNSELSKLNPLIYVNNVFKSDNNFNNVFKNNKDNIDYIFYQIAKKDLKLLKSLGDNNPIHLLFVRNYESVLSSFSGESLNYLLDKDFKISSYRKEENSNDFYNIIEKMIDSDLTVNDTTTFIKQMLSFNAPNKLLEKIITRYNININFISQDASFWDKIKTDRIFQFCLNHGAETNSKHLYSLSFNIDNYPLELFLKNTKNIDYNDEKGNILHSLCNYNGTFHFEEIMLLIDKNPDWAVETNQQNKFPVSYLIVDFNKMCKTYLQNKRNDNKLNNYYTVIKEMFLCGLESKNKKAFSFLESQLLKYEEIHQAFPDLLPTLRAGKLM